MRTVITLMIIASVLVAFSWIFLPTAFSLSTIERSYLLGRTLSPRDQKRLPIYQTVTPPLGWIAEQPSPDEELSDSRRPLITYRIGEEPSQLVVTIHNFPIQAPLDPRIAVDQQLTRWKGQMGDLLLYEEKPLAMHGFVGKCLYAEGRQSAVLAWAMQLAEEHYGRLQGRMVGDSGWYWREIAGDYTIKAVGPPEIVRRHRQAVENFSRSLELIHSLPAPS